MIRPEPSQYLQAWKTSDGVEVKIRPICPEDEPLLIAFHRTLSDETVRQRYFGAIGLEQRTMHDRLMRVCSNDHTSELALVVEHIDSSTKAREILAVGRLCLIPGGNDAELALLVSDKMQHHGIGRELATRLINAARAEKISELQAWTSGDNHAMQRILQTSGFVLKHSLKESTVAAIMLLDS